MFEKMLATLLYWFAALHQTSTFRRLKIAFFTRILMQYLTNLVFPSKDNRKWPKMAKTKIVPKTANWRRSEAKG